MWRRYPLTIGLPHTNYRGLAEVRLLMEAGNFFWMALGEALGRPVAQLRKAHGAPVYATICYLEEIFPAERALCDFRLDDRLRFWVGLRSGGPLAVEGRIVFDREDRLSDDGDPERWWAASVSAHPMVQFGGFFASPGSDGKPWQLATPVNARMQNLAPLPVDDNPAQLVRRAQETGRLGLIPDDCVSMDLGASTQVTYIVDPDRDTNAAGLVYFANYVAFVELGERQALRAPSRSGSGCTEADLARRKLMRRRIAYYGNANLSDRIVVTVARHAASDPGTIRLRTHIGRGGGGTPLGLSEAVLSVGVSQEAAAHQITAASERGS